MHQAADTIELSHNDGASALAIPPPRVHTGRCDAAVKPPYPLFRPENPDIRLGTGVVEPVFNRSTEMEMKRRD